MIIVNNNTLDQKISLNRYSEGIAGRTQAFEIISEAAFNFIRGVLPIESIKLFLIFVIIYSALFTDL